MSNVDCRRVLRQVLPACLLAFAPWAVADQYHYDNMLIGDRASGMGGAYAAVADDPSGLYYNPAGIVYSEGTSVSGSMNAYHRTTTTYKNVLGSGGNWSRESSALVPNYFGFLQPLGKGVIGFSYAVTDSILEDQDQLFSNITVNAADGTPIDISRYYINFNNDDRTYKIGPTYAQRLTDNFSLGMTLYGYYRHQQLIFNQQIYYQDTSSLWTNQYFEINESGLEPVLGMIWSPMNRLSLGLSWRKVFIRSSNARTQATESSSADPVLDYPQIGVTSKARDFPQNLRAGAAYFASDKVLVAGDLSYYTETVSRVSITNFALGTEYYPVKNWALRMGLYSNYANTPPLQDNRSNQLEHTDLLGLSLSGSHFTRNSTVSLGLNYSTGTGSAQVVGGTSAIQDVQMASFTLFLSAVYSY